jgi:hypothetical protein
MKKQTVVATVLLFLAAALPPSAQGQPPTGHETPPTDHTIFKAQGFNVVKRQDLLTPVRH